jgi:hypothetical protein
MAIAVPFLLVREELPLERVRDIDDATDFAEEIRTHIRAAPTRE